MLGFIIGLFVGGLTGAFFVCAVVLIKEER